MHERVNGQMQHGEEMEHVRSWFLGKEELPVNADGYSSVCPSAVSNILHEELGLESYVVRWVTFAPQSMKKACVIGANQDF